MSRKIINITCVSCDYKDQCNRSFEYQGKQYIAKEQNFLRMKCRNIVQDICRDCILFHEKRCASWKVVNGKEVDTSTLEYCPKKETVED